MKRKGGTRRKSRTKLTRHPRQQGKKDITSYLQTFEDGDAVVLELDPSVHEGHFHPRFNGRSGVITGQQGDCYKVAITDKDKEKTVIAHPVHLTAA